MLIVIGNATAAHGRRDDLVTTALQMVAAATDDDGCQSYGFYSDLANPDTIVSIEVWRDHGALDAHMTHEHTQHFLAAVPDLVDGSPTVVVHQVANEH